MALYRIDEFYPNYQEQLLMMTTSRGDVYAGRTGEKIGTIDNALVDGVRSFPVFCRRLVLDFGKVLLTSRLLPN